MQSAMGGLRNQTESSMGHDYDSDQDDSNLSREPITGCGPSTEAQYRIVNADTGRRLMDYAIRAHADAWLSTARGFRVVSQHCDSAEMGLHAIYVESQAAHATSSEG